MFNLDLKKIRERINAVAVKPISQQDLATMLAAHGVTISQTQISRYEEHPEGVPISIVDPWLRCLGTSIAQEWIATQKAEEETPVNPSAPYQKLRSRLEMLRDYAASAPAALSSEELTLDDAGLDRLLRLTAQLKRKPNLVLTGLFDAGKTTMANWLLAHGTELPEDYSPTTRIVTYIHHVEDRPEWIKERVVLLRDGWNHLRWLDEAHTSEHRLVAGDLATLRSYGVHGGESADAGAQYALVFIDASILKACNIIDHPGYGNTDEDAKLADTCTVEMDALVYLSNATGFMRAEEIERLRYLIRALPTYELEDPQFPTLGNLFIVATHAFPQIKDEKLEHSIIGNGVKRIMNHLGEHEFSERSRQTGREISTGVVRSRVFSFCREVQERHSDLQAALKKAFGLDFSRAWMSMADKEIDAIKQISLRHAKHIAQIEDFLETREKARLLAADLLGNEASRKRKLQGQVEKIHALINQLEANHQVEFAAFYNSTTRLEEVERVIRAKFSDKKEAQQEAGNYIKGKIEHQMRELARLSSDTLKQQMDVFLDFLDSELRIGTGSEIDVEIPFDAKGAFRGGVAAAGAMGALSIWAATFAGLGGYGVAATTLGWFGLGGAGWMAGIAGIGGPAVLAIGIGVAIFFGVKALFGEDWQKRLAKNLVDVLEKRMLKPTLATEISKYWGATRTAFSAGVAKYEADLQKYSKDVQDMAYSDPAVNTAQQRLQMFSEARQFFANIPWVPLST